MIRIYYPINTRDTMISKHGLRPVPGFTNPFVEFYDSGEPVVNNANLLFVGLGKSLQPGMKLPLDAGKHMHPQTDK